jgi:hypothetical protein
MNKLSTRFEGDVYARTWRRGGNRCVPCAGSLSLGLGDSRALLEMNEPKTNPHT